MTTPISKVKSNVLARAKIRKGDCGLVPVVKRIYSGWGANHQCAVAEKDESEENI